MREKAVSIEKLNPAQRQLVSILKEEYSFYQSLYILLDKQRDMIKYDKDDKLLDLYAEIERCRRRIAESEEKITKMRSAHPDGFANLSNHPAIRKLVNSIITMLRKNMALVEENEGVVKERYNRIRSELEQLKNSSKILQYLATSEPSPQFVDGRK